MSTSESDPEPGSILDDVGVDAAAEEGSGGRRHASGDGLFLPEVNGRLSDLRAIHSSSRRTRRTKLSDRMVTAVGELDPAVASGVDTLLLGGSVESAVKSYRSSLDKTRFVQRASLAINQVHDKTFLLGADDLRSISSMRRDLAQVKLLVAKLQKNDRMILFALLRGEDVEVTANRMEIPVSLFVCKVRSAIEAFTRIPLA